MKEKTQRILVKDLEDKVLLVSQAIGYGLKIDQDNKTAHITQYTYGWSRGSLFKGNQGYAVVPVRSMDFIGDKGITTARALFARMGDAMAEKLANNETQTLDNYSLEVALGGANGQGVSHLKGIVATQESDVSRHNRPAIIYANKLKLEMARMGWHKEWDTAGAARWLLVMEDRTKRIPSHDSRIYSGAEGQLLAKQAMSGIIKEASEALERGFDDDILPKDSIVRHAYEGSVLEVAVKDHYASWNYSLEELKRSRVSTDYSHDWHHAYLNPNVYLTATKSGKKTEKIFVCVVQDAPNPTRRVGANEIRAHFTDANILGKFSEIAIYAEKFSPEAENIIARLSDGGHKISLSDGDDLLEKWFDKNSKAKEVQEAQV